MALAMTADLVNERMTSGFAAFQAENALLISMAKEDKHWLTIAEIAFRHGMKTGLVFIREVRDLEGNDDDT